MIIAAILISLVSLALSGVSVAYTHASGLYRRASEARSVGDHVAAASLSARASRILAVLP